jgi:hypothetical protein
MSARSSSSLPSVGGSDAGDARQADPRQRVVVALLQTAPGLLARGIALSRRSRGSIWEPPG